ncbi:hypothetical protein ACEPAF_7764 [Sanghuangporus sanghuang]
MGFSNSVAFALAFVASFALSFLVAVPLFGTLVRFRANYTPKGLQLDGEGGVQPHTGPVVNSYFAMFMRVKRLEGWPGLYKGFMPTLISSLFIVAFITVLPGTPVAHTGGHKKYSAPVEGIWNRLAYSLFMMIFSLPVTVITNRAITTPYKLPWLNAAYSLRILLTASERRRPWLLYLTPGLMVSEVLRVLYIILIMDPLRLLLFPMDAKLSFARLSAYLGLAFVSTIIICPLEVVSTRLSMQRNHATSDFTPVAQEEDSVMTDAVYSAAEEDVIGLRNEDDPYLGCIDCAKRIVNEEGYSTLFRAWWLVFIPMTMVAFSP